MHEGKKYYITMSFITFHEKKMDIKYKVDQ
jgi:hypothetical protein